MKKEISILPEESEKVEALFLGYSAYMNMLNYLTSNTDVEKSAIYDKKWHEAMLLWADLEKAKSAIKNKYKPQGDWDSYEFNFDHQSVVFLKGE